MNIAKRAEALQTDLLLLQEFAKLAPDQDLSRLQKDWSDRAREAAAEARRHKNKQAEHERQALHTSGAESEAHSTVAAAHAAAATRYDAAVRHYGKSKGKTAAQWGGYSTLANAPFHAFNVRAGLTSPLAAGLIAASGAAQSAGIGLGIRAIRGGRAMRAGHRLGALADHMSSQFA